MGFESGSLLLDSTEACRLSGRWSACRLTAVGRRQDGWRVGSSVVVVDRSPADPDRVPRPVAPRHLTIVGHGQIGLTSGLTTGVVVVDRSPADPDRVPRPVAPRRFDPGRAAVRPRALTVRPPVRPPA